MLLDQAALETAMSEAGLGAPLLNRDGDLSNVKQYAVGGTVIYQWRIQSAGGGTVSQKR